MRYAMYPESHAAHDAYTPEALYERPPYPVPEVSSRTAATWSGERLTLEGASAPAAVLSLAEFAREHSWEVRTQYSRGMMPHGITGKPGALRHLIGLRFGGHPLTPRQAFAVYTSPVARTAWTWDSIWIWGPDLPPFGRCGIAELKDYLEHAAHGAAVLGWIGDIRQAREDQAQAGKDREAMRKAIRQRYAEGESVPLLAGEYNMTAEEIVKIISAKRAGGKEAGG